MSALKNFIAYRGPSFTVEWYYTKEGKSPAWEYFQDLDMEDKIKTLNLMQLMATEGKIFNQQKFRHEGDGIYAFKPKPHRLLCFFCDGKKIIVTNGFVKKQDAMPPEEKKRALKYRRDYEERLQTGRYYEET
ncbi:MAG: type II toxin-antitoxin system RelE/ParE family toxin [Parachlamydia sp.]|nr:type II toxin-antitoxin system RelE/ParE family toxin [Parachlamydia sp.]